ncbi:MAG: MBL fold metallo-hydrolase [Planctomycetota bacterium]
MAWAIPSDAPGAPSYPRLRVLASGSGGNCSVLHAGAGGPVLIDAGLSPRRTGRLLADAGVEPADLRAIVLTHLDNDHFYASWARALPPAATLWVHAGHAASHRLDPLRGDPRLRTFDGAAFTPAPGLEIASRLARHDDEGVATLRVSFPGHPDRPGDLGFLTDLGEVTPDLVNFHAGVDVLAIESNYCPGMQAASDRPDFLKHRITGGRGHLSNQQCLEATEAIAPTSHAVFLHLSRECNDPDTVAALHEGAEYARTIASQDRPSRWVGCAAVREPHARLHTRPRVATVPAQPLLFGDVP